MMYLFICIVSSYGQSVQFNQLNFNYDGTITNNSDWGAVDLTFIGSSSTLYLNLVRDTGWVIENMPVLTLHGVGISQTLRYWFPIGIDGVPVSSITYGYSLTTDVLTTRPAISGTTAVLQDSVIIYSGDTWNSPRWN